MPLYRFEFYLGHFDFIYLRPVSTSEILSNHSTKRIVHFFQDRVERKKCYLVQWNFSNVVLQVISRK